MKEEVKNKMTEAADEPLLFADLVDEENIGSDEALEDVADNSVPIVELAESTQLADTYKKLALKEAGRTAIARDVIADGHDSDAQDAYDAACEKYGEDEVGDFKAFQGTWRYLVKQAGGDPGSTKKSGGAAAPSRKTSSLEEIEASDVSDEFKMLAKRMGSMGAKSDGGLSERVQRKFDEIEAYTLQLISGRSAKKNLLICGDGGIGKTFSVKKVIKSKLKTEVKESLKSACLPGQYAYARGNIGNSASDLCAYFFAHRNDNLLLLDDCDAILGNPKLANFLKGMLDSNLEPTPNGKIGNRVTFPGEIIKLANKKLAGSGYGEGEGDDEYDGDIYYDSNHVEESTKTGIWIGINEDRLLNESVLDISFGARHIEEKVDNSVREFWLGKSKVRRFDEHADEYGRKPVGKAQRIFSKLNEARDDDGYFEEEDPTQITGGGFWFTAPLIMISNMDRKQIDAAVRTRFTIVQINLTSEEFLCRAEQILDKMELAQGSSGIKNEEIQFGKRQVHGALKVAIEAANKNISLIPGEPAPVIRHQLQFRIYNDLFGAYIFEKDNWMLKHKNPKELLKKEYESVKGSNPKLAKRLADLYNKGTDDEIVGYFIQPSFLRYSVLPLLAQDD